MKKLTACLMFVALSTGCRERYVAVRHDTGNSYTCSVEQTRLPWRHNANGCWLNGEWTVITAIPVVVPLGEK